MHVHLIGVAGTGMGALAGMLKRLGHRVTGSDTAFYPPMGDALARWGVETRKGWEPANLEPAPDLVIVGNVCRPDNVEARRAIDSRMRYMSFPQAIEELVIGDRKSLVVAGTHGKTTTTALVAHLLAGMDPGFLIGGIPKNFDESFRFGAADAPFVIEGDEYDTAFFEKKPKFWRYKPYGAIVTSIEHDHVDIYRDLESYRAAFRGFVERLPADGVLVAFAGDPEVRALARASAARVVYYALDGDDTGGVEPIYRAAPVAPQSGMQPFDLFGSGSFLGRWGSPLMGVHNLRNAIAAVALAVETMNAPTDALARALGTFRGVKRRQELLAEVDGVRVYDDFAHHPTAVRETLRAFAGHHPGSRLLAIYEPRSATASRKTHEAEYASAFEAADWTLLAPVGRKEIAEGERLDVGAIAERIRSSGKRADAAPSTEAIVEAVRSEAKPGDVIAIMSNGAFDAIHDRIIAALTARRIAR
jgi:UDP-N-acetylmuramate: L-alanyl-gamma-D-glutamyl-meso-diaminopimelate ligase